MSTPNIEVPLEQDPTVEIPAIVAPVPVVEQKRYTYQPKDKQGRPIGGVQVIVYTTEDELRDKLVNQNVELVQKLREVTRENRLGTPKEDIPADAERFTNVIEFSPKPLSAQERFDISQQLNDPERFAEARDRLLESAVGVPPAQLTKFLNDQQIFSLQSRARENYRDFVNSESGKLYFECPDNRETVTDWMFKNNLAPTVSNFVLASSKLREAGLLLDAPVVQQDAVVLPPPVVVPPAVTEPNPQVPLVPESRITPPEQVQEKRHSHVPSGLNERVSSASGASPVVGSSLTLADIDKMSADAYKAKSKDPAFRQLVDKLEKEAVERRRAKNNQV